MWTEAREAELKALWAIHEGRITRIAKQMGLTRGCVDGKSRLLGLQFHVSDRGRVIFPGSDADAYATTVYPNRVRQPDHNVLKSGANQRKLGAIVRKGKWKGFPIFSLTLEERATCPRSCRQWLNCYGNNMGRSIRYEAGAALEAQLWRELIELQRQDPKGFVVRLHILGDFYSVEYVRFWERALKAFPALHVFGYTARNNLPGRRNADPIGVAVEDLRSRMWDRFAVRTSGAYSGPRTKVIQEARHKGEAIICPAQTNNRTCATCALCWTTKKPIAFLQH